MRNLIQELSLQEMQKTFGGKWVIEIINGVPTHTWRTGLVNNFNISLQSINRLDFNYLCVNG